MAKGKSKNSVVSINFKGVEGRGKRTKPGEYLGEVEEVVKEKGKKGDYLAWTFALDDGGKAFFNTSLTKNSLWNLRGLLEAMGEDVPDDEMDLDLEEFVGKRCGIVIELEEYEGKQRPKMVDYFPEDDFEAKDKEDEDEDKDDKKDKKDKKKGKKKGKKEAEKVSVSTIDENDRDDLEKLNEEHDLEVDFDDFKDDKKGLKKLREAIKDALKDKDLLEEESDDKLSRDTVEGMDEDELKDLIKDKDLDVDLDDYKTLKKMVKAVIEKLEEADLLED